MGTRTMWVSASLVLVVAAPANAQIAERARDARQRPSVVVTIPGRQDGRDRTDRDRNDRDRADRDRNDRDRAGRDRDRYNDWRDECRYDARRGDRDRGHDWYDRDGRWDCGDVYRANRYPSRNVDRGLVRSHNELQYSLEREHDKWHRSHGWSPRNNGWHKSHANMHERLEREHERWHRRYNAPYAFWYDRPGFAVVPGHASGVIRR